MKIVWIRNVIQYDIFKLNHNYAHGIKSNCDFVNFDNNNNLKTVLK